MVIENTADGAPLISVVIPTMNSATLLPRALQSLAEQTFRDFEVVVSDGGSLDGTAAIAEQFAASLPGLQVDSRADTGVYDAINRGVRLSRGLWFLVLGSDDCLHSGQTLSAVANHLRSNDRLEMVHGDVRMMAINQCGVPPGGRFAGAVSLYRLFSANICQQSIFYKRSLFEALGGFDEQYRLYADWDFNLRAAYRGSFSWIDLVVADYAATGMSATAVDAAFMDKLPELIRAELMRHSHQRSWWPLRRRLLVSAKQLRRKGQWRLALVHYGSYFHLLALQIRLALRGKGGTDLVNR